MKQVVSLIILLTLCLSLNAQIKTYPVSPYMVEYGVNIDTTLYHSTYTGLKTVGKGDLVYLTSAKDAAAYAWTIKSAPNGSTAALDFTNTKLVTFRPDMTGDYVVELTADGVAYEITIVSATFLGNNATTCGTCHSTQKNEWEETGHSTIFTRAIDGTLSGHYGSSCISCHTVGYNEDTEADNGGFDDVARTQGWVLPATLQAGNWDALNADLKAKSNIQCENCHGPASGHTSSGFSAAKMDVTIETGMCAKCHDDNHYHRRPKMWASSAHAHADQLSAAGRPNCQPCHSGTGFIAEYDETPGIEYSTTNPGNISCAVCHDPHASHDNHDPMITGAQEGQVYHLRTIADVELNDGTIVTVGGTGKLCMNCHKSRRNAEEYVQNYSSHFGPHYNNQTDMVLGTNAITFGRYIPSSTHRDALENFCVSCHMAPTADSNSPAYDKIGDHSFNMSYDNGTPDDESDDIDNVDFCQTCHGASITSFDSFMARKDYDEDGTIESAREELHGLLDEVGKLLPPYGDPAVTVTNAYSKLELKAAYNYLFVEEDQSMGMHNFQYAVGLLKVTLEALNYGVLTEGEIIDIADVPNDNGRQVFVRWTRFGGDGVSDNPIHSYVVYREDGSAEGKVNADYTSFDQVPGDAASIKIGSTVLAEGAFWTTVAVVPADFSLEYSVVAPTLYDATPADTVETTFMVKGVTVQGLTAETAPKSGFSVDNLIPTVPTNVNGIVVSNKVELAWDEPVDEDFNYFAVYRSRLPLVNPTEAQLYATTTENTFVDENISGASRWFYKVTAFDFTGNQSDFSSQVIIMLTGVAVEDGIPESFNLSQNYPNPFNPTTNIKFAVPENSNVKITIYNAVGKEVGVLVNGQYTPGYYNYSWDASNLASGVYFYEMITDNFRQVQKMMLMK
ncbi:MAG: hypothetical protein CMF23_00590 [Ignavibacteriae bacterium]|nr:hypothetical protein [Ignavibacteriota bacterium]